MSLYIADDCLLVYISHYSGQRDKWGRKAYKGVKPTNYRRCEVSLYSRK